MTRDQTPSVEESKQYYNGEKSLKDFVEEWLGSDRHLVRVRRMFHDFFGVTSGELYHTGATYRLNETDEGALFAVGYHMDPNPCDIAEASSVDTWWGETVQVCPDIASTHFWQNYPEVEVWSPEGAYRACTPFIGNIRVGECGCGPNLVLCSVSSVNEQKRAASKHEFRDRAVYVYENDLSWDDLFRGKFVFGNRYSVHNYFALDYSMYASDTLPAEPSEYIATMMNTPLDTKVRIDLPADAKRYGIATMSAFMEQYNTHRAMTSKLVETLLCREVNSSLNISNIQRYVNPDVSETAVIEHNQEVACASCHFVLDNMVSSFQRYYQGNYVGGTRSEMAHVFGQEGETPDFLVAQLLEHPDFLPCMARRVWEDLSGTSYDDISDAVKQRLIIAASSGPRGLIRSVPLMYTE